LAKKSDGPREPTQMVGFQMRLKESLRAKLEACAQEAGTSLNSEVIARLERSLEADRQLGDAGTQRLFLDMAQQISLAEMHTGNRWQEDGATYWAVRYLCEAALSRAKPPPPHVAAVNELEAERVRIEEKSAAQAETMKACGALAARQNTLADLVNPSPSPVYIETPRDRWHYPNEPERGLDDDEAATIAESLAGLWEAERRILEIREEIVRLLTPWANAQSTGKAIYQRLNAPIEPEPLEAA
jgi:hypothetical protein